MKRYVIVGTGSRVLSMFVKGLSEKIGKSIEITGVYDINRTRCEYYKNYLGEGLHIYSDFDTMLDTEKPDAVIVGTVDSYHTEYVVRSMKKGYDVICEKPLANTHEDCKAIRDAEKETGRRVTVTFNCRFMPYFSKLKELVSSGKIGRVYSVVYDYSLNRWHGGDYFKRWHRKMENSQGMLLHKSTHHFDIINWVLDDIPAKVSAMADRFHFGDEKRSYAKRCKECKMADKCESYKSQSSAVDEALYFKAEHEDGYIRDKCAFLSDTDIYDSMSVAVKYTRGTLLTYTLNLFSMREGFTLTLLGEKGIIRVSCYKKKVGEGQDVSITLMNAENEEVDIPFDSASGEHGGGDARLLDMIFSEEEIDDPLGRCADSFAGVSSAMIGIGANESIKCGATVDVAERLFEMR